MNKGQRGVRAVKQLQKKPSKMFQTFLVWCHLWNDFVLMLDDSLYVQASSPCRVSPVICPVTRMESSRQRSWTSLKIWASPCHTTSSTRHITHTWQVCTMRSTPLLTRGDASIPVRKKEFPVRGKRSKSRFSTLSLPWLFQRASWRGAPQ